MAIMLTCHLIETIWSKKELGMRAPFMVIDHNGQQHQTDVMKAGAVTVWNTKATFPYAPSSDLVVMAFDAAGRQPGAFIAQAVVDVAAMLQDGSLNASAALVNRRGQNVGVVLFDVGLVTSSRAMAAGLDIPSLTFSTQPVPSSPTAQLTRGSSPVASGRSSSPFAQLAVQRGVAQAGNEQQSGMPGTAQSISQKLVGSISQALVGALLGLETRDRDDSAVQQTGSFGLCSSSVSPKRMGPVSRSLDASPTRAAAAAQQQGHSSGMEASQRTAAAAAARQAVAPVRTGSPVSSPLLSRRSLIQQGQAGKDGLELPPAPPMALARSSTMASGTASAPPMVASASDRASFSAWQQHPMSNSTRSAASSSAAAVAAAAAAGLAPTSRGVHNHQQQERMAASASGAQTRNGNNAALGNRPHSTGSPHNAADARRPSQLVIPSSSQSSSSSPNPGNSATLSPLTEARNRLRLHRPQPLPPLSHLFPPQQREGLIPVGRAPTSPGGYSQATTTGYSQFSNGYPSPRGLEGSNDYQSPRGGPEEASADYDSLLREFDAADAAGKEAILFRELMVQQQERQAGSRHLLSMLSGQNQQEVLEHRQLMDALEGMASAASPVTSPARAAADAFASCFSSSTQITSGSSSGGGNSSDSSHGDTPFKHYPNLPEFAAPGPAAAAAAAVTGTAAQHRHGKQGRGVVSPAAASAVSSPNRPAAGGLLQQLSSAENDASPLRSARQGHKLLGDRVGQPGSAQSSPMSAAVAANAAEDDAAAVRQWNWQLLERMTQQEAAAATAAAAAPAGDPLESYAISNTGTELSDGVPDDAEAAQDVSEAAAAAAAPLKAPLQARVPQPAYTCNKAPGQLGTVYYTTSSNSSSSDQAGAKKPSSASSRWAPPPAKDAAAYSWSQPAFPFVAVPVEPSAPLMPVPEEYPCA